MSPQSEYSPTPTPLGRALAWGIGGSLTRVVVQLGGQILLARLLGPETYGLFIICALVVGLMVYVADAGIAYSLVHRQLVGAEDLQFVCTWQLVLGILATAVMAVAAPFVAQWLGQKQLVQPLQALALVLLLTALAAPASNMLKRSFAFKELQLAQLLGYLVGYLGVGVPMAIAGFGVWSLVCAWLMQALVSLIAVSRSYPIAWRLRFRHVDEQGFGKFAGVVMATNIVNWWVTNLDKLLVARMFSPSTVGHYGMAFNLVNTPTAALNSAVQSVVFSAGARQRGDGDETVRSYLASLGIVLLVSLPVGGVLAALATPLVRLLYGEAWVQAGQYLAWFAWVIPLLLLWAVMTPVLWNADRITSELKLQSVLLVIMAVVLLMAAQFSAVLVAQCQIAILVARTVFVNLIICYRLGLSLSRLGAATVVSLFIGASWSTGGWAGQALAEHAAFTPALQVVCCLAGAASLGLITTALFGRKTPPDVAAALHIVAAKLPIGVRGMLSKIIPRPEVPR